jgi:hypothetical protein
MSTSLAEHTTCWTSEYALAHCEGFRVFGPEGPAGYVGRVLFAPGATEPLGILVSGGGSRPFVVARAEILEVCPETERIVVSRAA